MKWHIIKWYGIGRDAKRHGTLEEYGKKADAMRVFRLSRKLAKSMDIESMALQKGVRHWFTRELGYNTVMMYHHKYGIS